MSAEKKSNDKPESLREARKRFPLGALGVYVPRNPLALVNIFSSLKNRNFAIYFAGMSVSLIGSWIQQVAMGWLVFEMTDSVFLLSVAVFLSQIPALFFTPFAGVLSDRFDRRKILMVTQSLLMLQSVVLAISTFTGLLSIPLLFSICLFQGIVVSFDAPTRQSFYAYLVPPEDLSNAIAINSTAFNGSRFIGPAIGGLLISQFGEAYCFTINSFTYFAILTSLFFIKARTQKRTGKTGALQDLREGFEYIYASLPIRSILALLVVFSFFGLPFSLLLPAFTKGVLGGESQVLGNMMSAIGSGALCAALYLAARKRVMGLGRVVVVSGVILGLSLTTVSFVSSPTLAYLLAFPMGFGMIAVAASSNTMLQSLVDDEKRGRVMSLFTMAFFGIPPLGSLFQGWLSNYIGMTVMIAISGLICAGAAMVFEIYRPAIRAQAREIYARKGLIIPEIASGLYSSSQRK